MAIITISRQHGSGGDAIARYVAQALGYDLITKEQIIKAAKQAQRDGRAVAPTNAENFLTEWYRKQPASFLPSELCYYELPLKLFENHTTQNSAEFQARMHRKTFFQKTIELLWKRGNVVIVGRGANVILKDEPDVLRIRLTTPLTTRAYRLMRADKVSYSEALDVATESDSLRARYVYETYQRHWEDETLYELILNTERIEAKGAVNLIVDAARGLEANLDNQTRLASRFGF
jgi:cytidylate kinase